MDLFPVHPRDRPYIINRSEMGNVLSSEEVSHYHITRYVQVAGSVNRDILTQALRLAFSKHVILSARFGKVDPYGLHQYIDLKADLEIDQIEVDPSVLTDDYILDCLQSIHDTPFTIFDSSLVKIIIYVNGHDTKGILLKVHHVICDGLSLSILMTDLVKNYCEISKNLTRVNNSGEISRHNSNELSNDWLNSNKECYNFVRSDEGRSRLQWWEGRFNVAAAVSRHEVTEYLYTSSLAEFTEDMSKRVHFLAKSLHIDVAFVIGALYLRTLIDADLVDARALVFQVHNRNGNNRRSVGGFSEYQAVICAQDNSLSISYLAKSLKEAFDAGKSKYLPYWHIIEELSTRDFIMHVSPIRAMINYSPPFPAAFEIEPGVRLIPRGDIWTRHKRRLFDFVCDVYRVSRGNNLLIFFRHNEASGLHQGFDRELADRFTHVARTELV